MGLFNNRRIFLDYAGGKNNPSGIHQEGVLARRKLEEARARVAKVLKCQAKDIVFTSGGTESDNLAILGIFEANKGAQFVSGGNPHIIISESEHPAIYESAKEAERRGAELSILPPDKIIQAVKGNTVLVSVIYANNETGAINPVPKIVREIKAIRKKRETPFPLIHTDATAAFEFLEVDINKISADLITIGEVLLVRPNVKISPIIFGGGQERGLRSGTENLASILDFADTLEKAEQKREKEFNRLSKLKQFFLDKLKDGLPQTVINSPKESIPNIVNISIPGALHEFLAIKLDLKGVAVSTGSSCDSRKNEEDKERLRFSFGSGTKKGDILRVIRILKEIVV